MLEAMLSLGPQYVGDDSFTARMRLHQSWYRASVLGVDCGVGPSHRSQSRYGNMLCSEDGDRGLKAMVRSVLEAESTLRLSRAFAVKHGVNASETSHIVRGQPRCFDHLLVSPHFAVDDCEYVHRVRTDDVPGGGPLSDHSALRAQLSLQ